MKPAGPERDKQIAEMRGDAYQSKRCNIGPKDLGDCPDYVGTVEEQPLCPDNCEHNVLHGDPKPYSTDISCAMELLGKHGKITWFLSGKFGYCAHAEIHSIGPHFCQSPTRWEHESEYYKNLEQAIADAISGAWMRWKEGK